MSAKTILVVGLINIETTLKLEDGFPLTYAPVRYPFYGVKTTVSGVGYNISRALTKLGDNVRFASLVGHDESALLVRAALRRDRIAADDVLGNMEQTAQSAILYDEDGKRAIFTDLKAIQETRYPEDHLPKLLDGVDLAVISNINFSRPLLQMAKARNIRIATDVHAIADIDDDYNRDYMAAADILFMSHENLPESPHDWMKRVQDTYAPSVTVIGMGGDGALLGLDNGIIEHLSAIPTRPVVNTIGAGDSLFSSFISGYARTGKAYDALRRAMVFASWKIGDNGGAAGFLDRPAWDALCMEIFGD